MLIDGVRKDLEHKMNNGIVRFSVSYKHARATGVAPQSTGHMTSTIVEREEVHPHEPAQPGRRRRFTLEQKRAFLAEAAQPGQSVSSVARRYGISPSLMFLWKRQMEGGALAGLEAGEDVVGESELRALKTKVRELERMLGRKTAEAEVLKDALELVRSKQLPWRGGSSNNGGTK
jgi:transposase